MSDKYKIIYSGGRGSRHECGVGIIIDEAVKRIWNMLVRVLMVNLKGKTIVFTIIPVYAPPANSSDKNTEKFYSDMEAAMKQPKSHDVTVILGDFNAQVENLRDEGIHWTWKSPGNSTRTQIDYISLSLSEP